MRAQQGGSKMWTQDQTYKIVRLFFNNGGPVIKRTVKRGLSLEQAQAHCKNIEASSRTCTNYVGKRRTKQRGPWFDSYSVDCGC
jgi:hypothetical protein